MIHDYPIQLTVEEQVEIHKRLVYLFKQVSRSYNIRNTVKDRFHPQELAYLRALKWRLGTKIKNGTLAPIYNTKESNLIIIRAAIKIYVEIAREVTRLTNKEKKYGKGVKK